MILEGGEQKEVEGTRPWGPSRKRVPDCLKGRKTTYTIIVIAEKSPREVTRAHFRYILGPPGPTQEMELMGPGGEGPSRSPRFLQPYLGLISTQICAFLVLVNRFLYKYCV